MAFRVGAATLLCVLGITAVVSGQPHEEGVTHAVAVNGSTAKVVVVGSFTYEEEGLLAVEVDDGGSGWAWVCLLQQGTNNTGFGRLVATGSKAAAFEQMLPAGTHTVVLHNPSGGPVTAKVRVTKKISHVPHARLPRNLLVTVYAALAVFLVWRLPSRFAGPAAVLLFAKAASLLALPGHSWIYWSFSSVFEGAMLVTAFLLLGCGWPFMKQHLSLRERFVLCLIAAYHAAACCYQLSRSNTGSYQACPLWASVARLLCHLLIAACCYQFFADSTGHEAEFRYRASRSSMIGLVMKPQIFPLYYVSLGYSMAAAVVLPVLSSWFGGCSVLGGLWVPLINECLALLYIVFSGVVLSPVADNHNPFVYHVPYDEDYGNYLFDDPFFHGQPVLFPVPPGPVPRKEVVLSIPIDLGFSSIK